MDLEFGDRCRSYERRIPCISKIAAIAIYGPDRLENMIVDKRDSYRVRVFPTVFGAQQPACDLEPFAARGDAGNDVANARIYNDVMFQT